MIEDKIYQNPNEEMSLEEQKEAWSQLSTTEIKIKPPTYKTAVTDYLIRLEEQSKRRAKTVIKAMNTYINI